MNMHTILFHSSETVKQILLSKWIRKTNVIVRINSTEYSNDSIFKIKEKRNDEKKIRKAQVLELKRKYFAFSNQFE